MSRQVLNTLGSRQHGPHFSDDIFKCLFLNENVWISMNMSLKFVIKGPNNNILALAQIMARCWLGDKPLSEPMVVSLLTHICVTRPHWINKTIIDTSQKQEYSHSINRVCSFSTTNSANIMHSKRYTYLISWLQKVLQFGFHRYNLAFLTEYLVDVRTKER